MQCKEISVYIFVINGLIFKGGIIKLISNNATLLYKITLNITHTYCFNHKVIIKE